MAISHPFSSIQSASKVFGIIVDRLFQIIYLSEHFELPQYKYAIFFQTEPASNEGIKIFHKKPN